MLKRRTLAELSKEEMRLFDDLWYARHMTMALPPSTPDDIREEAERQARRIEASRDPEYLRGITHDEYAVGRLHGMLEQVRWALGMEHDDEAILDT